MSIMDGWMQLWGTERLHLSHLFEIDSILNQLK